jgi:hypothetical protein
MFTRAFFMNTSRLLRWWILLATLLFFFVPVSVYADTDEGTVKRIELVISERKVQREEKTIRVTQGELIELVWQSDETAELHLHGYDISFEVSPETPAIVTFEAHATGRFPITSHGFGGEQGHGHEALLYIEVYPR